MPPEARRRHGRVRVAISGVLTLLAFLLVWAALVAPDQPGLFTPRAFVRLPLEGVIVIALALVLPAPARRLLAWVVGPAIGLLIVVKVLDYGFFTAFDRPFNPAEDWSYTHIGIETLRQSIGRTSANLVLAGAALAVVAAFVLPTLAMLRLNRVVSGHRRVSLQAVTALEPGLGAVLGAGCAARLRRAHRLHERSRPGRHRGAHGAGRHPRSSGLRRELRRDPYGHTPADQLLTGLRGKDVLLVFVESYGQVAVQGSSFSPKVDSVLAAGTKQLQSAGFGARSGWLTSSTFGGISWLAHSTMQSGLWIDNPSRYDQLVASNRLTLSTAFKRAGWRTVADVPSDNRYWPEGSSFYHYDKVYNRLNVGYHGPTYAYASMPDQYIYLALQRLELGKTDRPPLFAEVDLVSSHEPWTQVPPLIGWNHVGNGSIFYKLPVDMSGQTDGPWAGYGHSVEYTMSTLFSFVQHYAPQEPGDGRAGRPPAGDDGQRTGRQPRRADLDHRPRPVGAAADPRVGLGGRHAPQPAGAGLADERVPRPLPRRLRAETGDLGLVVTVPLPSAAVAVPAPAVLEQLPAATPVPEVADAPPRRLAGLDGVRGLAALFVVVNHVFLRAFPGYPVDKAPFWAAWFIYGRFAVVVFIVLSGFSLALSPARHGWRLDGVSRFARRRAWRILPPYWAALVFSLAVAWLLVRPPGQGVPGSSSVIVNGLLVQNLVAAPSPNRAFWSIAVEAQLYVLFPLLLLMVRRRGAIVMVAAVTLVVAMVGIVGPHVSHLDVFVIQSAPDLAALFAVGILAAGIVGASAGRRSWPWAWLALAAAAPVVGAIWWQGSVWTLDHLFWVDLALARPSRACWPASPPATPRRCCACWTRGRCAAWACRPTACT